MDSGAECRHSSWGPEDPFVDILQPVLVIQFDVNRTGKRKTSVGELKEKKKRTGMGMLILTGCSRYRPFLFGIAPHPRQFRSDAQ